MNWKRTEGREGSGQDNSGFSREKSPNQPKERSNAPESATHIIPAGKDVFFGADIDPDFIVHTGNFENAFRVNQAFYARFVQKKGQWGYFQALGITKNQPYIQVYRSKTFTVNSGTYFKVKMGSVAKLK